MVSLIAPPELFSAYAVSVDDEGTELDLRKGTHLRFYAGLGASFPLTPFVIYRLTGSSSEPRRVHFSDPTGLHVREPDLGQHEFLDVTLSHSDDDQFRTIRTELFGAIDRAVLLDQHGRVISARQEPPWIFASPRLHKLRIWGREGGVGISMRSIHLGDLFEHREETPAATPGLPIEGSYPWYLSAQGRDHALQRVEQGAPRQLTPMDAPFGPFTPLDPTHELARVERLIEAMQLGGGLERLIERIVTDEDTTPWSQRDHEQLPVESGPKQFIDAHRLSTLQTAAVDPGLARFVGFGDHIDDLPDLSGNGGWDTLAVIGLFALSPEDYLRYNVDLRSLLYDPALHAELLLDTLIGGLEVSHGREMRTDILNLQNRARERGLVAEPFVTFVAPVPPCMPPLLPEPQVIQRRWHGPVGNDPSNRFRAGFALPDMPLVSMSALGRDAGSGWQSRHEHLDTLSPERVVPGIFGHELEPTTRLNEIKPQVRVFKTAGLLADQDIPADVGPVAFAIRASDAFGRFGAEQVISVDPPPRPAPPPPTLQYHLEPAAIDTRSDVALSPGTLKIFIAVPRPWPEESITADEALKLGAAIVVPRLDDLAPGALPLRTLQLELGTETRSYDLSVTGTITDEIPLPPLAPQEKGTWALIGRFYDTAGTASKTAAVPVNVTDARPPKTYPTGVGLFWTSAPGPSPEVELQLRWPADNGTLHRVYLTDQAGLAIADQDLQQLSPDAPPSPALVAALGCQKVLDGEPIDRGVFRLITEQPITANADDEAVLTTTFPRTLRTVQFLRVVPLGPDGLEPPFEDCGVVAVAVPNTRQPPAPALQAQVDPLTGKAIITVAAEDLDLVDLKNSEPGLFDPNKPGIEQPQAAVRRAVTPVPDPLYARTIKREIPLGLEDPLKGRFTATIPGDSDDGPLKPFVRYLYWAQVRMPAERRLPANFTEVDPPRGITPLHLSARQSHPSTWSSFSAPHVLMYVPQAPPASPNIEDIDITRTVLAVDTVEISIRVLHPPRAHPLAVNDYRLALWTQWPNAPITPTINDNDTKSVSNWFTLQNATITAKVTIPDNENPATLKTKIAIVDPVGRISEILEI